MYLKKVCQKGPVLLVLVLKDVVKIVPVLLVLVLKDVVKIVPVHTFNPRMSRRSVRKFLYF